jgi:hypothetical protein
LKLIEDVLKQLYNELTLSWMDLVLSGALQRACRVPAGQ